MDNFIVSKKAARLIVLQRIELISSSLKKVRKIFGRFIFSSFITKFFLNEKLIGESYHNIMLNEFSTIEKFINKEDDLPELLKKYKVKANFFQKELCW